MWLFRPTTAISPDNLARDCLQELHMWPGCETVVSVAVLRTRNDRFVIRVVGYGSAQQRLADRALRCIQREKLRHHHLSPDGT